MTSPSASFLVSRSSAPCSEVTRGTSATGESVDVTPLKPGNAKIQVSAGDESSICEVTVSATLVETIVISGPSTLEVGQSDTLIATVSPSGATNKNVTWESNAPHLADVNNSGKVTVKASAATGKTVYITAKTEDGGFTARCEIKIKASVDPIPVTSISLDITSKKININDTFEIVATINPSDASDKHIDWSSSNEDVAEIISVGPSAATVKGLKNGTATITASCGGKTATCKVTVGDQPTPPPTPAVHVESVSIQVDGKDTDSKTINLNETLDLVALINPSNADNKNVTWMSSNDAIAKVDARGQVTGIAAGTATITVKTVDGGKIDTISIKVVDKEAQAKDIAIIAGVGGGTVAVGVGCGVGIPLGIRAHKKRKLIK